MLPPEPVSDMTARGLLHIGGKWETPSPAHRGETPLLRTDGTAASLHGGYFATSCEFALLPGYFDRHSRRVGGHHALEAAEKQEEDRWRINDPVKASSSEGEAKFLGKVL